MDSPGDIPPMSRATRELIRSSSTSLAHLPLATARSPPVPEKSPDGNAWRGLRTRRTLGSSLRQVLSKGVYVVFGMCTMYHATRGLCIDHSHISRHG